MISLSEIEKLALKYKFKNVSSELNESLLKQLIEAHAHTNSILRSLPLHDIAHERFFKLHSEEKQMLTLLARYLYVGQKEKFCVNVQRRHSFETKDFNFLSELAQIVGARFIVSDDLLDGGVHASYWLAIDAGTDAEQLAEFLKCEKLAYRWMPAELAGE